jgi:hypothetical protein
MISFVTTIKLCQGYADYATRLETYINNIYDGCRARNIAYEIIVVEDQNEKNTRLIRDLFTETYLSLHHVRLIEFASLYPNPRGYNMIEAYGKNRGIKNAKHTLVCVTNCDIWFSDSFFDFIPKFEINTFYRFMQYEVGPEKNEVCLNAAIKSNMLVDVAYKSGDIMLMDKRNWLKIRGFPENGVWVHSDYIVCLVVHNNRIPLVVVPEPVKVFTLQQVHQPSTVHELTTTYKYVNAVTCN